MNLPRKNLVRLIACIAISATPWTGFSADKSVRLAFDEEMKSYKAIPASDAVAALNRQLQSGDVNFAHDPAHGYLLELLRALKIPVSSQILVASKTSPNKSLISPKNPRALYFNDRIAIAYVPSASLIEVASTDPKLGLVFYTLNQKPMERPKLDRDDRCLECHSSSKTLNVPGLMVRSFRTQDDGDVDVLSGLLVNHRTPLSERWGGYYVTGTSGAQAHRGNLFFGLEPNALHKKDGLSNVNITDLKPFVDTTKYPEPGSDLVALMTLEHQAHAENLLTRLHYDAINAMWSGESMRAAYPSVEAALRYMLFVDEYPLAAPVRGSSDFYRQFEMEGPKDKKGRSLRQFDLQTRLFKHPCSYMIYSPTFDALPIQAKRHFYHRLLEILDGEDRSPDFAGLTRESRQAIREILVETKKDLPADWQL